MKASSLGYALSGCAAAAMLAGCGGSQPPIGTAASMQKAATKKIFNYTGHKQTFVVRQSSAAGHSLQRWLR
jgi:hypothetical protein